MNNDEKKRLRSILTTLAMFASVGEQVRQLLFEEIENIFEESEKKPQELTAKELVERMSYFMSEHWNLDVGGGALLRFAKKEAGL